MTFLVDGTLGGTFPSWTTATRPASPAVGQMGYNTTTGLFDNYTAAGWVSGLTNASQSIPKSALPTGTILQVVNATYSTSTSSTSSTYASSGLSATITPTSASSKIFIVVNGATYVSTSGWIGILLTKNGSSLYDAYAAIGYKNDSYGISYPMAFNYVDSPATTSATTYGLYFRSGNPPSSVTIQNDGKASVMTLMEIAA